MLSKLYDFIIRKHLEILTVIFVGVSLLLLSRTENHVVLVLQTRWQDFTSVIKKPLIEQEHKRRVMEENRQLRKDVFLLKRELAQAQSLMMENQRLRDMLGFRDTSKYELLPALIVYKGFKDGTNIITLNRGKRDNVKENSVIVNKEGLVGRVIAVGNRSSLAGMIAEPEARLSICINPVRVYGILKWHHGNIFVIDDIPTSVDVREGWTVMTSGLSEIYPENIPVGRITKVTSSENGFTYLIEGEYFVPFKNLREVFIFIHDR
ncbi:MAG: rod shape-determining protein MreC [Candidatus Marinimicrobia bacterium]|nr:rod shape-determining protein MreC [Candidatus Neomarinimicrobiota bacterium]